MNTIRLIGYWKSAFEMALPHPINFVDSEWNQKEKNDVIKHLKKSQFLPSVSAGHSYCRLCNKKDNGNREKSDGKFVWPEGFLHYVEEHNVKPPKEFIDNCINNDNNQLINWDQECEFDNEWWNMQRGKETPKSKSFKDPYIETYPKFYNIKLKTFDKNKLKFEYKQFLKDMAIELDSTTAQIHLKLTKNEIAFIVSEKTAKKIDSICNKKLFVDIKTTTNRVDGSLHN